MNYKKQVQKIFPNSKCIEWHNYFFQIICSDPREEYVDSYGQYDKAISMLYADEQAAWQNAYTKIAEDMIDKFTE
jgi:hypothetical protein